MWEQQWASDVASAATWTTVRRLRYRRTTSIRGRRTSDRSASSCCESSGKAAMERYLWFMRMGTSRSGSYSLYNVRHWIISTVDVIILNISIIYSSVQVFQVKKVVGAAAGKIFAMKVLKKVLFYLSPSPSWNTILLLSLQFRVMYSCSQSVSCGRNDCTLGITNKHYGASVCKYWLSLKPAVG